MDIKRISKNYNGTVDVLKFVFAILIVLFHIGMYYGKCNYFEQGRYGVEFFFMVSAYFMCCTIDKHKKEQDQTSLGRNTIFFIWAKLKVFLYMYLYIYLMAVVFFIFTTALPEYKAKGIIFVLYRFLHSIQNFLLLEMGGLKGTLLVGITWYLSAMLIGMFILYPIVCKWGENYKLIIAPLTAVLMAGWVYSTYGSYGNLREFRMFATGGLIRAIIDMNIGCFVHGMTQILNERKTTESGKIKLTILEVIL